MSSSVLLRSHQERNQPFQSSHFSRFYPFIHGTGIIQRTPTVLSCIADCENKLLVIQFSIAHLQPGIVVIVVSRRRRRRRFDDGFNYHTEWQGSQPSSHAVCHGRRFGCTQLQLSHNRWIRALWATFVLQWIISAGDHHGLRICYFTLEKGDWCRDGMSAWLGASYVPEVPFPSNQVQITGSFKSN